MFLIPDFLGFKVHQENESINTRFSWGTLLLNPTEDDIFLHILLCISLICFLWIGAQLPQEIFISSGRILTLLYYFIIPSISTKINIS